MKQTDEVRQWNVLGLPEDHTVVHVAKDEQRVYIESWGENISLTFAQISRLDGMIHPVKRHKGEACDNRVRQVVEAPNPHGDDDHGINIDFLEGFI